MINGHAAGWDGTRLHFTVAGKSPGTAPAIVLNDGIGCDGFIWKYLRPQLAHHFTVVNWNYRGHGQSGRARNDDQYTMVDNVKDVAHIMNVVGIESAIHMGHSMGVQVCLEASLTLPERVNGLVLMCGSHGRPLDTFHDRAILKKGFPVASRVIKRFPHVYQQINERFMPTKLGWYIAQFAEVDGRLLRREDFLPYLEHLASMDPAIFITMLESAGSHTTEERLDQVDKPVLILGGEKDRFTPYWVSEVMAERLPKGQLHMIRGGTHTAPLEQPELTQLIIEKWMREQSLLPSP